MKRILGILVAFTSFALAGASQTPQEPKQENADEVIRVSTNLVQTDVVVLDKNDQPMRDLKIEDFEISDAGKKQDLKFLELVTTDTGRHTEGTRPTALSTSEENAVKAVTARNIRRVIAFVVDDLTLEYQDIPAVRELLLDYVDNKMQDGDLVAIFRVVGGKGLLQQFTSDKQLLRQAIQDIRPTVSIYKASGGPDPLPVQNPLSAASPDSPTGMQQQVQTPDIFSPLDDQNQYFRGVSTLSTTNYVISALGEIPGRKDLFLLTGGIPLFSASTSGDNIANISLLLRQTSDNAMRNGVVVNTLDPKGLRANPGVKGFQDTPAKSSLGISDPNDATFGKGTASDQAVFGALNGSGTDHLGVATMAEATGGVSIINTNNFKAGLSKVLSRSSAYYVLAYTPSEKFDGKFHKLQIKVRRGGAKVIQHDGYIARETRTSAGPMTKEQEIVTAARSPLSKDDLDVSPSVTIGMLPDGNAQVDIDLVLDAKKLHFTDAEGGKHKTSIDVVGFLFNETGKSQPGFSTTINADYSTDHYQHALQFGIPFSAHTELKPGSYQIRCVVREAESGSLGSFSKYIEVPDLSKGRLAMGSVILYSLESKPGSKPQTLNGLRELNKQQDLRYAAMVYNPKPKDSKGELRSRMIISQGDKIMYQEPETGLKDAGPNQAWKIGQLGLAKVPPGRYTLTVVVTEPVNDKKIVTLSHSIDFVVSN